MVLADGAGQGTHGPSGENSEDLEGRQGTEKTWEVHKPGLMQSLKDQLLR